MKRRSSLLTALAQRMAAARMNSHADGWPATLAGTAAVAPAPAAAPAAAAAARRPRRPQVESVPDIDIVHPAESV